MNIILITGASSGLGMEFAKQIDRMFHKTDEIWLVARRKDKLEALAQTLQSNTRIIPIDLTNDFELQSLVQILEEKKPFIKMLVNCAGYGTLGAFSENEINDQIGMIELNCVALTKVTHLALPYLGQNSRIIQLASSAAFLPQQNFAVYAATKSYVLSFSRALNRELKSRNIYITAVCPGPVDTEFFDIAEKSGGTLAIKKKIMVKPDKVVNAALRDSYNKMEISVYSIPIKLFYVLAKIIPHTFVLWIMKYLK